MEIQITKKVSIQISRVLEIDATIDEGADFEQIAVRLRKEGVKIDFRIIKLGDAIEVEAWKGKSIEDRIVFKNDSSEAERIQAYVLDAFAFV